MKEHFWSKLNYIAGVVALVPLFGFIILCANIEIKDLDLWLHLKTGQYILQHKMIPAVDMLSCTIAGKPWINHEWLFQVVVQSIFDAFGPDGLINMQVGIIFATFTILLFMMYSKNRQFAVVFLLLMTALVYQARFTIRPDIFSILFFVLYFLIISRHIDKRWSLYALVVIQVVWSNVHGFFFLGPLIIMMAVIAESMRRNIRLPYEWNKTGKLYDAEYLRLKRSLVLVILACLVNPYTFRGAWYPVDVLLNLPGESRVFFDKIQELQPPITWGTLFTAVKLPYKVLIVGSSLSFFLNRKKIDIGSFFIWGFFLVFSLAAVRNLTYFAMIACLACIMNFKNLSLKDIFSIQFKEKKFHFISAVILKLLLIIFTLHLGYKLSFHGYFDFDALERKSEFGGVSQRNYPAKGADFLVANNIKGNFFNDFNSGAYLVGRVFPDIKVFIDGRTEVYGPDFFQNYTNIWKDGDAEAFDKAETRYGLTGAFLNSTRAAIPSKILEYLHEREDWVLVYLDYDAAIFLKDVPANKTVIRQHALDLSRWKVEEMDLKELGPRKITPYRHINRAYTLESLGYDDAALAEVAEALRITPYIAAPYKLRGKIYGKREENIKAFENFRVAALLHPMDFETRFNFALAYEKLGDFERAIGEYKKIMRRKPNDPKVYFRLAKAYAENKQHQEAVETLQKASEIDPKAVQDIFEIGDIMFQAKAYIPARKTYEIVLRTGKSNAKAHMKIGLSYKKAGFLEEARVSFEKSLALEPENKEIKKYLRELTAK